MLSRFIFAKGKVANSAFCQGKVRHRRFSPKENAFTYKVYMTWLDLDEVASLDQLPFWSSSRFALVQFRRKDFIGDHNADLKEAVYEKLISRNVQPTPGKIYLLANLRSWGFSFNPVSFYFCFDDSHSLYAIVAEITNTPWQERHAYVLPIDPAANIAGCNDTSLSKPVEFDFDKVFHISPFMPMDMRYSWRFQLSGQRIGVHMKLIKDDKMVFDASLALKQANLNRGTAIKAALGYPLICSKVLMAIYWQAFRLWLKKVPVYSHPGAKNPEPQQPPQGQVVKTLGAAKSGVAVQGHGTPAPAPIKEAS